MSIFFFNNHHVLSFCPRVIKMTAASFLGRLLAVSRSLLSQHTQSWWSRVSASDHNRSGQRTTRGSPDRRSSESLKPNLHWFFTFSPGDAVVMFLKLGPDPSRCVLPLDSFYPLWLTGFDVSRVRKPGKTTQTRISISFYSHPFLRCCWSTQQYGRTSWTLT